MPEMRELDWDAILGISITALLIVFALKLLLFFVNKFVFKRKALGLKSAGVFSVKAAASPVYLLFIIEAAVALPLILALKMVGDNKKCKEDENDENYTVFD